MTAINPERRQAIPVLYTRGTHYDVGFDMGRTFASIIKSFLEIAGPLNETYVPLYTTPHGKYVYNETLASVRKSFPQYVRELEGIADGADVEFDKLFLLHMDDILPRSMDPVHRTESTGCSTIILNNDDTRILAHTEDTITAMLNHYYFVVAHIVNDTPQGKYNVTEERFMSLCYAGHLPGYAMNYNHHGLVFSINTLSAAALRSGKTPRHFLTRALLATRNYEQALEVLTDECVGAADGCSINMAFLNDDVFYNIEMAPASGDVPKSRLDIKPIPRGTLNFHVNKYERLDVEEASNIFRDYSDQRLKAFAEGKTPSSKADVLNLMGDYNAGIFHEDGTMEQPVKTIAVGVFDLMAKTVEIYSDNPRFHQPLCTLPLILSDSVNN